MEYSPHWSSNCKEAFEKIQVPKCHNLYLKTAQLVVQKEKEKENKKGMHPPPKKKQARKQKKKNQPNKKNGLNFLQMFKKTITCLSWRDS